MRRLCSRESLAGATAAASSSSASPAAAAWTSRDTINSANQRVFSTRTDVNNERALSPKAPVPPNPVPQDPEDRLTPPPELEPATSRIMAYNASRAFSLFLYAAWVFTAPPKPAPPPTTPPPPPPFSGGNGPAAAMSGAGSMTPACDVEDEPSPFTPPHELTRFELDACACRAAMRHRPSSRTSEA